MSKTMSGAMWFAAVWLCVVGMGVGFIALCLSAILGA